MCYFCRTPDVLRLFFFVIPRGRSSAPGGSALPRLCRPSSRPPTLVSAPLCFFRPPPHSSVVSRPNLVYFASGVLVTNVTLCQFVTLGGDSGHGAAAQSGLKYSVRQVTG